MSDEGKFSRAMSKADASAKRSSVISEAPPEMPLEQELMAPQSRLSKIATPLRRMVGQADEPSAEAVFWHDTSGEAATQIRALRARILADGSNEDGSARKPPRIIAVTSANRGEGKTTISMNLAAALSEIGEGRIIAVDGDLLGPTRSLSTVGGITPEAGLVDVLATSDMGVDDCVYETLVPHLDILPSSASAVEDSEEYDDAEDDIESRLHQSCAKLLQRLAQEYAYVIVDTPPVRASSYACTFAKHSDMTIMVVRSERTSRHVVKRATRELAQAGAPNISCLLTHQKHHIPSLVYRLFGTPSSYYYGYRRGYGRKYGYRYGYGRRRSKKASK